MLRKQLRGTVSVAFVSCAVCALVTIACGQPQGSDIGAAATSIPTVTVTQAPTPLPPLTEIPTPPPVPPGATSHITYQQPSQLPKISEQQAIDIARHGGGLPPDWPSQKITTAYVLLTDTRVNLQNEQGTPIARNQPVWVVTAHGLPLVPSGPAPLPGATPAPVTAIPTDWNIVIDALNGTVIEAYTS